MKLQVLNRLRATSMGPAYTSGIEAGRHWAEDTATIQDLYRAASMVRIAPPDDPHGPALPTWSSRDKEDQIIDFPHPFARFYGDIHGQAFDLYETKTGRADLSLAKRFYGDEFGQFSPTSNRPMTFDDLAKADSNVRTALGRKMLGFLAGSYSIFIDAKNALWVADDDSVIERTKRAMDRGQLT